MFDPKLYEKVFSDAYHSPEITAHSDEDEDPEEGKDQCALEQTSSVQGDLQGVLSQGREKEMEQLRQNTITGFFSDDNMGQSIFDELDLRAAAAGMDAIENRDVDEAADREREAMSPVISTQHSYPPINQSGQIRYHDRPFAEYGHLDR
jgi:hypothetical protein